MAESDPPELFAQMVKGVRLILTNGVPEITPLLNVKPLGNTGYISQVAAFPPTLIGAISDIVTPLVNATYELLYDIEDTGSRIVMISSVELEPPELFAQTVNVVWDKLKTGVPLIEPFSKIKPLGNDGCILHVSANPPLVIGVRVDGSNCALVNTKLDGE